MFRLMPEPPSTSSKGGVISSPRRLTALRQPYAVPLQQEIQNADVPRRVSPGLYKLSTTHVSSTFRGVGGTY